MGSGEAESAAAFVPDSRELDALAEAAADCRGCDLYRDATQTVFGDGAAGARVVFLGEQPGDAEDQEGEPFVGPAGRELDRGLEAVGIPRDQVWVTNVVKHFRFTTKGRKRLHQSPTRDQVDACRPWLDAELQALQPEVIVCLGANAARSMLGSGFRVTRQRGELHRGPKGVVLTATVHPASILRAPSDEERHAARDAFHADLAKVADLIHRGVDAALAHETKAHLYELAQEEEISGRSNMSKAELVEAVAERIAPREAA